MLCAATAAAQCLICLDFHFGTKPTRVKTSVTAKENLCVTAWMNQSVDEDMDLHQPSYTRTEISVVMYAGRDWPYVFRAGSATYRDVFQR